MSAERQARHAKIVNGPVLWSGANYGVRFTVTGVEVRYSYWADTDEWRPMRFGPVTAFGYREDGRFDSRNLRPPAETDWYRPVVDALTPEPGLPEFDIEKENT